MSEREKKQQAPKAGKVIRVSDFAWDFITSRPERTTRKKIDQLVCEVIDLKVSLESLTQAKSYYLLPESGVVCRSLEEARGEAIVRAVKKGKKKPTERPIEVREVV